MMWLVLISFISVQFNTPKIETKRGETVVKIEDCALFGEPGSPILPVKTVFIAGDVAEIKVKSRKLTGNYHIQPALKAVPITHPELFKETPENKKIYNSSGPYPEKPYKIVGKKHLLGVEVTEVVLYPITYFPRSGKLVFNYKFEIEPSPEQVVTNREAAKILNKILLNPDALRVRKDNNPTYLIITSSSLAPYFEPLINWKKRKGIRGEIVITESIYSSQFGRDNAEKIRNFLKIARSRGIVYVLLGGDTDVIPARYAFAMDAGTGDPSDNDIPADLYYSDLDGTWDANGNGTFGEVDDSVDLLPDVIVGRAPVSTPSEVSIFVSKVINYERNHQSDYFSNALFLASYLDDQTDGGVAKDMVADVLPVEVTRLYERDGMLNRSLALYYLGLGANMVNHDGHGSWYLMQMGNDYLNPQDFDNLTNGPKLTGVFYSLGCWTCAIDEDCIAEHFVKASNGGGFYIGNSRYGWYIPGFPGYSSSDQFDVVFFKELTHSSGVSGAALAMTKAFFAPYSEEANDFRWSEYDLTYLGDPEMSVFVEPPESLNLSVNSDFHRGWNSVEIRVRNGSIPVVGARVSFIQNDSLIYTTETDSFGMLHAHFELPSYDSLHVTVFHPSYFVLDTSFNVYSEGGFPVLELWNEPRFSDSHNDTLRLIFANLTSSQTSPMVLEVTAQFPLTAEMDSVIVPSLVPGDSIDISIPLEIASVDDDTLSEIVLTGDTTYSVRVGVFKGRVVLSNYFYTPLVAGGSGILRIQFKNLLPVDVWNVKIPVVSLDPRIDLSLDTIDIRHLASEDSLEFTSNIIVGPSSDTLFFPQIRVLNDTIVLSVGYSGYEFSFESSLEGWTVINDHWHRTAYRASQGNYSIYVGDESTHRYPPGFVASIVSPYLIVPDQPELSFDTYYEAQPGWDFCMVSLVHGDSTTYLATFSGPSNGWETHKYRLSIPPGDSIRIKFTFYSEDNSVQYEGWYIDNVTLNRNSIATGVEEHRESSQISSKIVFNGILVVEKRGDYFIYDVTGKKIAEFRQSKVLNLKNLPGGVYFLTIKNSPGPVKKLIILR